MPEATTLGRSVNFIYNGSVLNGVVILYGTSTVRITSGFFDLILNRFRGLHVAGGFLRDNPTPHGFGEWIRDNSHLNVDVLTPQHASRIGAILVEEGYATSTMIGRSVYITFF